MSEVQTMAWGNPSSLHRQGLAAAEVLERCRWRIASQLNSEIEDVVFTSGATESVHLALLGFAETLSPGRLVISAVEHPAVIAAAKGLERLGWDLAYWPVDRYGTIDMNQLDRMLAPPTRLVSLIWGQSEVGTLQPIETVGRACAERGIPFHTDATQVLSQGRPDWQSLPVDLLSASAHKFGGPKGIGVLLARAQCRHRLRPRQGGGGQEHQLRAGTESVALLAGMATAIEQLPPWLSPPAVRAETSCHQISDLRDQLLDALLEDPRLRLTGDRRRRLPHHISLLVFDHRERPLPGRAIVRALSQRGIAVSSGSACSSGKYSGSSVLAAMGFGPDLQRAGLRLSLGSWIHQQHLPRITSALIEALNEVSAQI